MLIYNYVQPQKATAYPVFTGKPMSVTKEEIQACIDAGMRNIDIANKYGKSRGWVNWVFLKLGIQEPAKKTKFVLKKEAQAQQMVDGLRNGQSMEEIAKSMNMKIETVRKLKKYIHPKTMEIALAQGKLNTLLKQLTAASKTGETLQESVSKLCETPMSPKKSQIKEQILALTEEFERNVHQTCKDIKDKLKKV